MATEIDYYVNILDVFQTYFKKKYNMDNLSLFDNIDDEESSNEQLDELYDAIEFYKDYQNNNDSEPPLLVPDEIDIKNMIDRFGNIYGLEIDGTLTYISMSLFTIIAYVASLDWIKINWNIITINNT